MSAVEHIEVKIDDAVNLMNSAKISELSGEIIKDTRTFVWSIKRL